MSSRFKKKELSTRLQVGFKIKAVGGARFQGLLLIKEFGEMAAGAVLSGERKDDLALTAKVTRDFS